MTTVLPGREFEVFCEDSEFVLSRLKHPADGPPTRLGRPAATPSRAATVTRLEHAHALRGELEASRAARPIELIERHGELALWMEDPGGQVVATLLGQPWEVGLFLRVGAAVASALSGHIDIS